MLAAIASWISTPPNVSPGTSNTPPMPMQPMKNPATPAKTRTENIEVNMTCKYLSDSRRDRTDRKTPRLLGAGHMRVARGRASVHDHSGEHISLQHDQHADQTGKCYRVQEHEAQDRAFVAEPVGRGRSHHDRLGVDHL